MKIDLANWFEIFAAVIAILCFAAKPLKSTGLLAIILIVTLSVEFNGKYLNQLYLIDKDMTYVAQKFVMYSLFNIVKFAGFTWFIYFLLDDSKNLKLYLIVSIAIFAFVFINICFIQGYNVYNNYSTVVGIIGITLLALVKVRSLEEIELSQWKKFSVFVYLFTIFFYYAINLPTFVFINQMLQKNVSTTVQVYRTINDSANYLFYACLSLATVFLTFKHRPESSVKISIA